MTYTILILVLLNSYLYSQTDPREYHHSMNIVGFTESNQHKYYISWASSYGESWEQDIFYKIIYFDPDGSYNEESEITRYIGSGDDGAQEPVSVAIDSQNNTIFSAWEDGTDLSVGVDVRGQLHYPNGNIVKMNFNIAGGEDAQHSTAAAHSGERFIVVYADEASPAQYATVIVKILSAQTGLITQTLKLTDDNDDNWWPVISSDQNKYVFVGWGDGISFYGSILTNNNGVFSILYTTQYFSSMNHYYYQVQWLEHLSKFIVIAKAGSQSKICLIDTFGICTKITNVSAPITRETKFAVKWSQQEKYYTVAYTTNFRDIAILSVTDSSIYLKSLLRGEDDPLLKSIIWVETGIAMKFVRDINGNDLIGSKMILLIGQNDHYSNDAILLPLKFDVISGFNDKIKLPFDDQLYQNSPNPFNPNTVISYRLQAINDVDLSIYNLLGQKIATLVNERQVAGGYDVEWNANGFANGIYYYRLSTGSFVETKKLILLR